MKAKNLMAKDANGEIFLVLNNHFDEEMVIQQQYGTEKSFNGTCSMNSQVI